MKKVNGAFVWLWSKRVFIYLIGLYCMAIGVVFSAKSSLGVSPETAAEDACRLEHAISDESFQAIKKHFEKA